jgi:hypothetical protein
MHSRALTQPPITLLCARYRRRRHAQLAAPNGGYVCQASVTDGHEL